MEREGWDAAFFQAALFLLSSQSSTTFLRTFYKATWESRFLRAFYRRILELKYLRTFYRTQDFLLYVPEIYGKHTHTITLAWETPLFPGVAETCVAESTNAVYPQRHEPWCQVTALNCLLGLPLNVLHTKKQLYGWTVLRWRAWENQILDGISINEPSSKSIPFEGKTNVTNCCSLLP